MIKNKFAILRKTFLLIFVISFSLSLGYAFGLKGYYLSGESFPKVTISRVTPEGKELNFSLFWQVWDTLESRYYDKEKIIPAQLVYGAIKGMVAAVGDPYTVFLPPQENKVVQEDLQGNFDGVGIQIGFIGTQLAVIAPLPDSPAEIAGLKAGDLIIAIKDEKKNFERATQGITLPEAVQAIRGPRGSVVTLTIMREGQEEPLEFDITRANIDVPSIRVEYVGEEGTIAHINVLKFGGETKEEWDKAVAELLLKPEIIGLVLDVRNNPGGYLQGAADLASDFVDNGKVVVIEEEGNAKIRTEYKNEKFPRLKNFSAVVLINKGSASASEILAGALRDQNDISLVGEKTFGKGTIQEPQQLEDGVGLHITIARWLTPDEVWVDGVGLEPDFAVEDDSETEEDEQLQKAIELLQS